jgi:hypothetical protein
MTLKGHFDRTIQASMSKASNWRAVAGQDFHPVNT